jgi:hypothetical protein
MATSVTTNSLNMQEVSSVSSVEQAPTASPVQPCPPRRWPNSNGAIIALYDPELVPKDYSRKVQPVSRQPIVMTESEFDDMVVRMRQQIAELQESSEQSDKDKADDMVLALSGIRKILNYRGLSFIGPHYFCHTCAMVLGPLGFREHGVNLHQVSEQDSDKPTPGFIRTPTAGGLGIPALFARSGPAWTSSIHQFGGVVQSLEERERLYKKGVRSHTRVGVPAATPIVPTAPGSVNPGASILYVLPAILPEMDSLTVTTATTATAVATTATTTN